MGDLIFSVEDALRALQKSFLDSLSNGVFGLEIELIEWK